MRRQWPGGSPGTSVHVYGPRSFTVLLGSALSTALGLAFDNWRAEGSPAPVGSDVAHAVIAATIHEMTRQFTGEMRGWTGGAAGTTAQASSTPKPSCRSKRHGLQ